MSFGLKYLYMFTSNISDVVSYNIKEGDLKIQTRPPTAR
jgi:hypothetical protein